MNNLEDIKPAMFLKRYNYNPETLEYVDDIIINAEKHYGIKIRGTLLYNDSRITVHGYVVLERNGSSMESYEGSQFIAYIGNLSDVENREDIVLFSGTEAVDLMRNIFGQVRGNEKMEKDRSEVNISNDAM